MATTKKEEIICLMFSYYVYILKVKLNTHWQMSILFQTIFIVDEIAFFIALYQVNNFWHCKKFLCFLAKKVNFIIKNILLKVLTLLLKKI